jgi:hypothetical protein
MTDIVDFVTYDKVGNRGSYPYLEDSTDLWRRIKVILPFSKYKEHRRVQANARSRNV